ncbi:tRNA pseudouridine38-40 synthase [Kineococcus xinjiangensis]|uniref:tRNA pseudouridine synthase A n=1 Tax=Kineococcus xinjiangensis TaxID=512762 RepID=A0A2S6IU33_9ACTN|nr:tRNA pseudouridine(38-40) synthase TruA [Kineococcus xinjiangensis]PPK97566.1 tRNA pseudouridine38-40 synthase [Kineococcus xinjiangensis]
MFPSEPALPEQGSGGLAAAGAEASVRLRLDLGYDGTGFSGWAAQPGLRTVEETLAEGLQRVLRLSRVRLVVAGRTDAGVHATGQVAHLDVPVEAWLAVPGRSDRPPAEALLRRLAGVLPPDVRVHAAQEAPTGFDARFSAVQRRYAYRVSDHPAGAPPLRRHDVLAHRRPLDAEAMDAAAGRLVGLHDFAAFCKPREGATTIRTLLRYRWCRDADGLLVADVRADAFCHSMVRALVGALLPVGEGRRDIDWPVEVLTARRRDPAVAVVPPLGLSLEEVGYPPEDRLADRAQEARAVRQLPPAC